MVSVYANVYILYHLCCTSLVPETHPGEMGKIFFPEVGGKDWDSPKNPEAGMFLDES